MIYIALIILILFVLILIIPKLFDLKRSIKEVDKFQKMMQLGWALKYHDEKKIAELLKEYPDLLDRYQELEEEIKDK